MHERLWEKTRDTKCANQLALAKLIEPNTDATRDLAIATRAKSARKEGGCSKPFRDAFTEGLCVEGFTCDQKLGDLNDLLNYSYAVLLSTVLQKPCGLGLDPTVGVSHAIRK